RTYRPCCSRRRRRRSGPASGWSQPVSAAPMSTSPGSTARSFHLPPDHATEEPIRPTAPACQEAFAYQELLAFLPCDHPLMAANSVTIESVAQRTVPEETGDCIDPDQFARSNRSSASDPTSVAGGS